ncbi:hypothetical protein WICMUC_005696 [Wickerhamomyces mucosus]|uniref:Uncharacterized protein n=1 Tax=Wickerhamomyces mucosus TaxID=1378264 RepID=A0A9P8P5Y8_9ASCO|nr:hypothetical protein WICMUC_005696 [Wickerhamomyces mucosus]
MSNAKRSMENDGSRDKRPKIEDKSLNRQDAIMKARERIAQLKAQKSQNNPKPLIENRGKFRAEEEIKKEARGLNVELHPLLSGKADVLSTSSIENPNLQKVNKRGYQINPYLDSISQARPKRELEFNLKGKYIKEGNEIRRQQRLVELKKKIDSSTKKAGLEPDLSIREDLYKIEQPPLVEWWDEPFLVNGDYNNINQEAISMYIYHPIPINAPWEKHLPPLKPMYLTKKEIRKLRRNERFERNKEMQDKIKLGLEPPPPPKVKLSNLMNVLTSEAIKDPTAVEQRVRKEIEIRKQEHLAANESRKLSKEDKHAKIEAKYAKDLQKGYYTAVFVIDKLIHPSHKFKVDTNAKQLKLVGTVLYISDQFALVIVEGSEKNIKFYKKLMLNRIKWEESTIIDEEKVDLNGNKCRLLWEGQLKNLHFNKWTIFRANTEEFGVDYLRQFGLDNYLREAIVQIKTLNDLKVND